MTPHDALVLNRLVSDTSLSLIWGGAGFALLCEEPVRAKLMQSFRLPLLAAASVAACTGISVILIQTAEIVSSWHTALNVQTIWIVASQTDAGISETVRAMGCLAVFASCLLGYEGIAVLLSGLALGTSATTGHAAQFQGLAGLASRLAEASHVLSATAWLGALVPYIFLVKLSHVQALRPFVIRSMCRFSRLGHGVVAAVFLSGIVSTLFVLQHLPWNPASPYEFKLLLKIGAALLMACVALANRYLVVPMHSANPVLSRRMLAFGALIEIALGLCALALVASFGLDDPR